MSNSVDVLAAQLQKTIDEKDKNKKTGYDTQATVVKVMDDTIWVNIPGGVDETPVARTVNAKEGDVVQIRVAGGRAWVVGNYTAPATDDTRAEQASVEAKSADAHAAVAEAAAASAVESAELAQQAADVAVERAVEATESANEAKDMAQEASAQATIATNYANGALTQLGVVEDVLGTLQWITEHGSYVLTADTTPQDSKIYYQRNEYVFLTADEEVDPAKTYYTAVITEVAEPTVADIDTYYELADGKYSPTRDTVIDDSKTYYTVVLTQVAEPVTADIGSYYEDVVEYTQTTVEGSPSEQGLYELQLDDAVSNFVNTHLSLTSEGLYVLNTDSGYKVLLSNDSMRIMSSDGLTVATYGESISFDETRGFAIGNEDVYIKYFDSDNDAVADSIAIKADEIIFGGASLGAKLEQVDEDVSGVQSKVDAVETTVSANIDAMNSSIDEMSDDLSAQADRITTAEADIMEYRNHIVIDPDEPSIKVAADLYSYLKILPSRLSLVADNTEVVYLSNERLHAPSAVVNNLYMQTVDAMTGDTIGAIGWVMRSNGHLSMRRMR